MARRTKAAPSRVARKAASQRAASNETNNATNPAMLVGLRALDNERRLQILEWLKAPRRHFRPQVDGDLVDDGVCGVLIAEKLDVSQPTLSEHMRLLVASGFVSSKRIKQWTFYKRDEAAIAAFVKTVARL